MKNSFSPEGIAAATAGLCERIEAAIDSGRISLNSAASAHAFVDQLAEVIGADDQERERALRVIGARALAALCGRTRSSLPALAAMTAAQAHDGI